jgi:anthranilate phosphoribosyltransferase
VSDHSSIHSTDLVNRQFGGIISRLLQGESLSREDAGRAFSLILENKTTEMQQGAFLAALLAKGETTTELGAAWRAIMELDTVTVEGFDPDGVVENCGTGMDGFKTFNISTAASLVAASCGVKMARHGARALSSRCGTVDIAEALGVDVECSPEVVCESIRNCNIGLFNGMSAAVHPRALGRILSQIHFGTTLNISASLANPVQPRLAVRGVYDESMLEPVARLMRDIGYTRALVVHGKIDGSNLGMDEASVCGETICIELNPAGSLSRFSFRPGDLGLKLQIPESLQARRDLTEAKEHFLQVIRGSADQAAIDAVCLNAALVLYIFGNNVSIEAGLQAAGKALSRGDAYRSLQAWVHHQQGDPDQRARGAMSEEQLPVAAGAAL